MAQFQLHVAVTLFAGLAASMAFLTIVGPRKKTAGLPMSSDGDRELLRDPFDVTKPEYFVDGVPLDQDRFWSRVRSTEITTLQR